ncbi:WYL domain-containing transcriptional factor [Actinotignum timonense]|uniref:WYL domain-containing protein n=1 Tax=Actinotignum TaxID=1653174 RepID=UPI00254AFA2E|nr:WYL domain-containing protein [Actinotignum timonense]MDK6906093.1 WYL domain-containing protein [Actinotignum timonense]
MSADIVTTLGMLIYLHERPQGATLAELTTHFQFPSWKRTLDYLWDANLAETADFDVPFELELPERGACAGSTAPADTAGRSGSTELPENMAEANTVAGPESRVYLRSMTDDPVIPFTLDDAMVVAALLDAARDVTAPGPAAATLTATRAALGEAVREAGYEGALWPPTRPAADAATMEAVHAALEGGCYLDFSYERALSDPLPHARAGREHVIPLVILAGDAPLLRALTEQGLRHFRLDRITAARPGAKLSRSERAAARRALAEVEKNEKAQRSRGENTWEPSGTDVRITVTGASRWVAETLPGARLREANDELSTANARGEGNALSTTNARGESNEDHGNANAHGIANARDGEELLTIEVRARSLPWLVSLLVQIDDVIALEPPEVARAVADYCARLRAQEGDAAATPAIREHTPESTPEGEQ